MTPGFRTAITALAFAAGAFTSGSLGFAWLGRMSNHRGFLLVPVEDHVATPVTPPRRTLVVVLDGLGLDAAESTPMAAWLHARGRCFPTTHQTPTMSRPTYAVISTGLEQARTGARSNGDSSPLAAQSVWELMRTRGQRVSVWSDVEWWQELFPAGFSKARDPKGAPDPDWNSDDVALVHLIDADHAGHAHGAESDEYRKAAGDVSVATLRLLAALDLTQDLALVTADHGHWHSGGHGGDEPQVSRVLTCAVGKGVNPGQASIPGTSVGPLLAALVGLPFPRHMRAGDDGLDEVVASLAPDAFPPGYVADRTAAIERFRRAQPATSWYDLNARGSAEHHNWWTAWVMILGLLVSVWAQRTRQWTQAAAAVAMLLLPPLALAIWRGTFSVSVVATRGLFVGNLGVLTLVMAAGVHAAAAVFRRHPWELLAAHAWVLLACLWLHAGHILIHGWTPAVPLPGPGLWLLPLACAVVAPVNACVALLVVLLRALRA